jgi:hypothetical protein
LAIPPKFNINIMHHYVVTLGAKAKAFSFTCLKCIWYAVANAYEKEAK